PAVLVGDAALASVADGLDHGHADVTGLVLDRIDHRLDPLADHDRLHLRHVPTTSERRSSRSTSRHTPFSCPRRSCTPTRRKPQTMCSRTLALFSGKIPARNVQIPDVSDRSINASSSSRPTPRPRAHSPTYTLSSATPR